MNKRRVSPIGAAFVALVLLVLLFVVRGALHRPARIVLPQETDSSDSSDSSLDDASAGRVTVRPDTVQSAIGTLTRPARYTRSITIERYYTTRAAAAWTAAPSRWTAHGCARTLKRRAAS